MSHIYLRFDFPDGPRSFRNPVNVIEAREIHHVLPALEAVQRAVDSGLYAAGLISYEAAPAFDFAMRTRPPGSLPLLWFGLFAEPAGEELTDPAPRGDSPGARWQFSNADSDVLFLRGVRSIREGIGRGEYYQVNLTYPVHGSIDGDVRNLYRAVRQTQKPQFGALIQLGEAAVVSASPELFFDRDGATITVRPMKGTAPRGRTAEEDRRNADCLSASEKERAENLMIVDLMRNDLGRLAVPGGVNVQSLFDIEKYPTLFQMTSTVSARLRPEISNVDIFRALFPCGSVTGAPKIAAMHVIARLEREPRGVYCGAIGYLTPSGRATFSVAIRTAVVRPDGCATLGVGSGITWDSDETAELDETRVKTRFLTHRAPEFDLVETLLLLDGQYFLLERHLDRLKASAHYFGRKADASIALELLQSIALSLPSGRFKVRLLVARNGAISVETDEIPPADRASILPVALAVRPVDSFDRFLFHKTTHREVYSRSARPSAGVVDTLLFNELGEVTEFTRGNVLIRLGGAWWTPPRKCGLLAGTARAEIISRGVARERVVLVSELAGAEALLFVNAVRGVIPALLVNPEAEQG